MRTRRISLISITAASLASLIVLDGCSSSKDTATASAVPSKAIENRRIVKTTSDPEAARIDKNPKDITIEDIQGQKAPDVLSGREAPYETSVWRTKAHLKSVQLMKDGDYYLVMNGDKGGTTVVEVPDPANCSKSPFLTDITAARKEIEDRYHPTKDLKEINDTAEVTGVGFLGWGKPKDPKKAKGYTGARLMPGTGFKFDTP